MTVMNVANSNIVDLVQDYSDSSALAKESLQSRTKSFDENVIEFGI